MSTSGKTGTTLEDTNEASNILSHYLELLQSSSCNQLKFQLARNSVLDWFGRSVCGPVKIQEYLKNEICAQYEHVDFEQAAECTPIECRPTHLKTKQLPVPDVEDYVNPRNVVTDITSLKAYADSDLEEDETEQHAGNIYIPPLPAGHKTPERMDNAVIEALTPPASRTKLDCGSATGTDEDEEEDDFIKAKRLKRTHPSSPFSYLRRLPATAAKVLKRKTSHNEVRTLLDDTSSEEEEEDGDIKRGQAAMYTPLRYLETTGVLRGKLQQSLLVGSHTPGAVDTNSWNRPVRMRISYRRRLADGQPQYSLVIYEHLERADRTQPRRNLMSAFSQAAAQHDAEAGDDAPIAIVEEQPALVMNPADGETVMAAVATPTTEEIAAALETAAFTIVPLRTPTKMTHTPPATPKRKPRLPHAMSGLKRLNLSPSSSSSSTPKRSAARSLRL